MFEYVCMLHDTVISRTLFELSTEHLPLSKCCIRLKLKIYLIEPHRILSQQNILYLEETRLTLNAFTINYAANRFVFCVMASIVTFANMKHRKKDYLRVIRFRILQKEKKNLLFMYNLFYNLFFILFHTLDVYLIYNLQFLDFISTKKLLFLLFLFLTF